MRRFLPFSGLRAVNETARFERRAAIRRARHRPPVTLSGYGEAHRRLLLSEMKLAQESSHHLVEFLRPLRRREVGDRQASQSPASWATTLVAAARGYAVLRIGLIPANADVFRP